MSYMILSHCVCMSLDPSSIHFRAPHTIWIEFIVCTCMECLLAHRSHFWTKMGTILDQKRDEFWVAELRPETGFTKTVFSLGLLRPLFKKMGSWACLRPAPAKASKWSFFLNKICYRNWPRSALGRPRHRNGRFLIELVIETGPDPPWAARGLQMAIFQLKL